MNRAILPTRSKKTATRLLVTFIVLAAIFNVPWALTRMKSNDDAVSVPYQREEPTSRLKWPSSTPHAAPWPQPQHWSESELFGWKYFDVRTDNASNGDNGFAMQVQQLGWPWPVVEQKQMWWNWNDPKLVGPQSDPAPSLMIVGLVLNPIAVGFGAWVVLVLPWVLIIAVRRVKRFRSGKCTECGYPIGVSPVCTECGVAVSLRRSAGM